MRGSLSIVPCKVTCTSEPVPDLPGASLSEYMPARLPALLPACPRSCLTTLEACLPVNLSARLPTCQPAYLVTCPPNYSNAGIHIYLSTDVLDILLTHKLACLQCYCLAAM